MNRIMRLSAIIILGAAAYVRAQGVAMVDMEDLVRLHPNTAADKKLLEQTLKEYKAEGGELQQKLESLQDAYEKARKDAADPALSDKARKTAEDLAAKTREELAMADRKARDTMQMRQQSLNEQEMRMLKRTTSEIRGVIEKYAAENKLALVLPMNQVVYGEKSLDITDAILKRMHIQRPPPGASDSDISAAADLPTAAGATAPVVVNPAAAAVDAGAPAKPAPAPAAKP